MTDKLPANLLALFQPRPPLRYLPPCDYAPEQRRCAPVSGVAAFLSELGKPDPDYVPTDSVMQQRERAKEEKKKKREESLKAAQAQYKPAEDPNIRGDPYKTLFVSRLSYDVKESDLEREFARFGPIERIRIVRAKDTKDAKKPHRGYAFIVYEREKDMKAAYKETDGIRIKDRRVLVDVERGRTVKGWRPRRLGGGLGGRGYTKVPLARPSGPSGGFGGDRFGPRGGFGARGGGGGGFGGGFRGGRGGGGGGFGGPRGGGGFDRGPRGGIGYQGGGGFGGDRGGDRYPNGGHHDAPPPNAPTGPGGGGRFGGPPDRGGPPGGGRFGGDRGFGGDRERGGGFGGDRRDGGFGGDRRDGGGGGYGGRDDRDRGGRFGDRDRGGDDHGRKRHHEGEGYGGGGGDSRRPRRY